MLGALTYHAITAMTRDRLATIESLLLAKIRSQQQVTPLDRQVYFLARTAREGLSVPPHLPTQASLPPFARSLSLYAVFGSIGPTFPQFAAMYAPGQSWVFDTLGGGTPDPDRARVMARSTDVLLQVAARGTTLINTSEVADKPSELRKLRAYVLGHACHIAADLVSAPFVDAVALQLGDSTRAQLSPAQIVAAIEKAAAQLFRRDLVTAPVLAARGDLYENWWLKPEDLPTGFFEAFKQALEAIYGPGAQPVLRPVGTAGTTSLAPQVSAAFWTQFTADAPPELSVRLLEDGYAAFRSVMDNSHVWNFGDWLAGTAWMFLPPIAAYPLIVAMPHTRGLFKDGARVDDRPVDRDRGWFGLVMAPLATSALAPIVLSIYLAAGTYFGVGRETIFGWVSGGVNFITSIVFLATIGTEVNAVVRWLLLFSVPFIGLLVHAIYVLARGGSNPRHIQLALSSLVPCIITVVYVIFHVAWHQSQDLGMNGWLKETDGEPEGWGNGGFIGGWVLWAVLLLGAWLLSSYLLQPARESEPGADQFVTGRRHFLRLFGQAALFGDPNLAQNPNAESRNPTLATQYFPTNRRPLLKLWWTGGGDLYVRSDRNALQFSTAADGSANAQSILAPAAPMTAAEFGRFLTQAVKEGATFSQQLHAEPVDPQDFDYVLPPGDVFADHGDERTTRASHDADAAIFSKVRTSPDEPTLLFHAPRSHLASFQGTGGPVFVDVDRAAAVTGDGQATFTALTVTGAAATRFTTLFTRGDVIATTGVAAGNEARIVSAVIDDQHLTVTLPFTAAVAGAAVSYQRAANARDDDAPAGGLQATAQFKVYQGTGFDVTFLPGDVVRAVPAAPTLAEERTVVQVLSATQIMVDKPFAVAVPSGLPAGPAVPCVRVGRVAREGFQYAPVSPFNAFDGDSLMERAADLGALLSMGASTHLLSTAERQAVTAGSDEQRRPAVNPVYQVFRNWNLSHRRVNEWQMLLGGGAVSEKRGAPRDPDPLQPAVPAGWTALTPTGETVANQLGWVPALSKWLDVARRPGVNSTADEAFREGDPTNKQLSEAIAFLFDLPMPA